MVSYRLILMFTAVIGIVLVFCSATANGTISENEQLCSAVIKSGFDEILTIIAHKPEIDPLSVKAAPPFTGCQFYGITGMITIGDCPNKKIGDCKSIIHTVSLRIVEAKLVCSCELKSNPAETLKDVVALYEQKNMGLPCNMSVEKLKQYKPDKVDPSSLFKITELLNCKECSPIDVTNAAAKIPTSFGGLANAAKASVKLPPEKVKGTITAIWANVDIKVEFILDVPTDEMKPHGGQLVSQNMDDIVIKCEGSDITNGIDLFQAPCNCLKKAKFMSVLLVQFMNLMFPCYCDGGGADMMKAAGDKDDGMETMAKSVFSQISCKEFYC